ncbi:MAG TPA: hypothetical protein VK003_07935 [Oceanobacillus sp.]|nr:hypothetical protein [Oceanobacillus sp.]
MLRIVLIALFISGCTLTAPATNLDTPVPTTTLVARFGYLDMPYLGGDAGAVSVEAGATITVNWLEFPADAARYAIFQIPYNGEAQLIAVDLGDGDGVSVLWTVPQDFVGSLRGEAYDQNDTIIGVAFSPESVSADSIPPTPAIAELFEGEPPASECIAANTSPGWGTIMDNPLTLNMIGDLPPRLGAVVVGQMTTPDGNRFYQITLQNARLENGVTAELGWVAADVMTVYEPCSNIPEVSP